MFTHHNMSPPSYSRCCVKSMVILYLRSLVMFLFMVTKVDARVLRFRAPSHHFFPQKFWVKSESTPLFLSKNLSLERKIATNLNFRQKYAFRTNIELNPENAYTFNWSLSSGMNIAELGCRWGTLWFFNLPSAKNSFSASNLISLTHFPKWLRKSAKSLLYKTEKLRNSESTGGSAPFSAKLWSCPFLGEGPILFPMANWRALWYSIFQEGSSKRGWRGLRLSSAT